MTALTWIKKTFWRPVFRAKSKLNNWYVHTYVIPDYTEKRQIIRDYKKEFGTDVLIETGTFMGDTVFALKSEFSKIYSIELSTELAAKAQQRFQNDAHIKIIQGNSGSMLKPLLQEVRQPCLFWLDGHYSSNCFVNGSFVQTASGNKKTPVLEELETILTSSQADKHVILIDDARLFNGTQDYPSMDELNNFVHQFKPSSKISVKRDIIRIISGS